MADGMNLPDIVQAFRIDLSQYEQAIAGANRLLRDFETGQDSATREIQNTTATLNEQIAVMKGLVNAATSVSKLTATFRDLNLQLESIGKSRAAVEVLRSIAEAKARKEDAKIMRRSVMDRTNATGSWVTEQASDRRLAHEIRMAGPAAGKELQGLRESLAGQFVQPGVARDALSSLTENVTNKLFPPQTTDWGKKLQASADVLRAKFDKYSAAWKVDQAIEDTEDPRKLANIRARLRASMTQPKTAEINSWVQSYVNESLQQQTEAGINNLLQKSAATAAKAKLNRRNGVELGKWVQEYVNESTQQQTEAGINNALNKLGGGGKGGGKGGGLFSEEGPFGNFARSISSGFVAAFGVREMISGLQQGAIEYQKAWLEAHKDVGTILVRALRDGMNVVIDGVVGGITAFADSFENLFKSVLGGNLGGSVTALSGTVTKTFGVFGKAFEGFTLGLGNMAESFTSMQAQMNAAMVQARTTTLSSVIRGGGMAGASFAGASGVGIPAAVGIYGVSQAAAALVDYFGQIEAKTREVEGVIAAAFTGTIFGVIGRAIEAVTKLAGAFVSLGTTISTAMIDAGMAMQRTSILFEVVTGNAKLGKELFEDLKQTAIMSPFSLSHLSEAAQTLLSMGVSAKDVNATLSGLGNIAAGDAGKLQRLAIVFGEVRAEGRLTGQRLRQLAPLGIGVEDMAKTMGIPTEQFRHMAQAGFVPGNILAQTINSLNSPGGRFAGLNDRIMHAPQGQWQQFQGTIEVLIGDMGQAFMEGSKLGNLFGGLSGIVRGAMGPMIELAEKAGEVFGELLRVVLDLSAGFGGALIESVKEFGLTLGNPVEMIHNMREGFLDLVDNIASAAAKLVETFGRIVEKIPTMIRGMVTEVVPIVQGFLGSPLGKMMLGDEAGKLRSQLDSFFGPGWTQEKEDRFLASQPGTAFGGNAATEHMYAMKLKQENSPFEVGMKQAEEWFASIGSNLQGATGFVRKYMDNWKAITGQSQSHRSVMEALAMVSALPVVKQIPLGERELSPLAKKMLDDMGPQMAALGMTKQSLAESTTPLGKFRTNMAALRELWANREAKGFTPEQRNQAFFDQFEALRKGVGAGGEERLPSGPLYGSVEAQNTINRSMTDQKSVLDMMAITLQSALDQSNQQTDLQRQLVDTARNNPGMFDKVNVADIF